MRAAALLLLLASSAAPMRPAAPIRPNGWLTPGAVTDATAATLCAPTFHTTSIRPPASYTNRLKAQQMTARHLAGTPADYEEDHLVSLELGGDPRSARNLWPEPWTGACNAHDKDRLENRLHALVCAGSLPLLTAQDEIATDWIAAYRRYIGPLVCS